MCNDLTKRLHFTDPQNLVSLTNIKLVRKFRLGKLVFKFSPKFNPQFSPQFSPKKNFH